MTASGRGMPKLSLKGFEVQGLGFRDCGLGTKFWGLGLFKRRD